MKHNIIKGLIISAVFVFGIQLIATGTISKYNKSIPLSGVLTAFLPQETNNTDWKIHKFYSGSSATVNDDDSVLSKGRIDAVKTLYCGSNGYEVSINMPATGTANGFGFYVDGLYNDDTEVYNGLSIQYNGS
jgi:hypothetical protein